MLAMLSICLTLLTVMKQTQNMAIINGHCHKNISVKYQIPVTKTRHSTNYGNTHIEQYIAYEERIRWDSVQMCCPGYRTIIFGFCEPICTEICPVHSYCIEPNKCRCMRGYEHSHHLNKQHQLTCRPICQGGCPDHSHCLAYNVCECRPGYKDVSNWFSISLICERIQCGQEQRYDIQRRNCVKIEMSMEELMQRVAERLVKGLKIENDQARDERLI